MKIRSKRTDLSYEAVVYAKPNTSTGAEDIILRHAFLQGVYDSLLLHGKVRFRPERKSFETGSPVLEAYSFYDADNGIFSVGELTWDEYNASAKDSVLRRNPNAYALNRCFDKWFIRYMKFEISADYAGKIYSDAEIPIESAVPLSGRNLTRDVAQANEKPLIREDTRASQSTPVPSEKRTAEGMQAAGQFPKTQPVSGNTLINPLVRLGQGVGSPAFAGNVPQAPVFGIPMPAPFIMPKTPTGTVIGPGNIPGSLRPGGAAYTGAAQIPGPPQKTEAAKEDVQQPEVLKCEYDYANAATLVITSQGTLLYSPLTQPRWRGVTLDADKIPDLKALYESASKLAGIPLDEFSGVPSFAETA